MSKLAQPLITFAIPSYNSEEYLHIALDSLIGHEGEIEILVIDDGSKDQTLKIAQSYAEKYSNIIPIHQENKGHGGAINTAIQHAKGLYFKVLDSDDWVNKDALTALLEDIKSTKELPDCYLTNYTYWEGRENESNTIAYRHRLKANKTVRLDDIKTLNTSEYFTIHSAMFRLETVRASGIVLPEHCFYEDNHFVYACLSKTETVRYLDIKFYQYLMGRPGQSMGKKTLLSRFDHIVNNSQRIFDFADIMPLKKEKPGLYRLLRHHLILMVIQVPFCCRMNGSKEAKEAMNAFYKRCKESNPAQFKMVTRAFNVASLRVPGPLGKLLVRIIFSIVSKVTHF